MPDFAVIAVIMQAYCSFLKKLEGSKVDVGLINHTKFNVQPSFIIASFRIHNESTCRPTIVRPTLRKVRTFAHFFRSPSEKGSLFIESSDKSGEIRTYGRPIGYVNPRA